MSTIIQEATWIGSKKLYELIPRDIFNLITKGVKTKVIKGKTRPYNAYFLDAIITNYSNYLELKDKARKEAKLNRLVEAVINVNNQ